MNLVKGVKSTNIALYKLSLVEKEEIWRQIDLILQKKLIRESSFEWRSLCIVIKKQNSSFKFCIDYQALNKQILKNTFPFPQISKLLDRLGGKRIFSLLDTIFYFWQVFIQLGNKSKLVFCTAER